MVYAISRINFASLLIINLALASDIAALAPILITASVAKYVVFMKIRLPVFDSTIVASNPNSPASRAEDSLTGSRRGHRPIFWAGFPRFATGQ